VERVSFRENQQEVYLNARNNITLSIRFFSFQIDIIFAKKLI